MGTTETIRSRTDDAAGGLQDAGEHAGDAVRQRTAGSPLGAGLAAFGLGMVVAAVWPSTEPERRMAGAVEDMAGDRVKELARSEGQALAEDLEEPAREALSTLEGSAGDAARSVADTAQGSGR